jgi:futalosine hydrolase
MFLVISATDFEMEPFETGYLGDEKPFRLVAGIGPVETAVRLYGWLAKNADRVTGIINFGVAGAYLQPSGDPQPRLLDICLAKREVLGDLGVCLGDHVEPVGGDEIRVVDRFDMDEHLLGLAGRALDSLELEYFSGTFVTVSCASGTVRRGAMLAGQYQGLCENMEGAAVARVCAEFNLPCLEVRCISNMVEDRDMRRWELKKACRQAGEVTARITEYLQEQQNTSEPGES